MDARVLKNLRVGMRNMPAYACIAQVHREAVRGGHRAQGGRGRRASGGPPRPPAVRTHHAAQRAVGLHRREGVHEAQWRASAAFLVSAFAFCVYGFVVSFRFAPPFHTKTREKKNRFCLVRHYLPPPFAAGHRRGVVVGSNLALQFIILLHARLIIFDLRDGSNSYICRIFALCDFPIIP